MQHPITYPLASDGVFATIQGEGFLAGLPTVFVRLAGCSVGCRQCDTDYRVDRRLTAAEIGAEVEAARKASPAAEWVWLTGGEPADQPNLFPLLEELKCHGLVAVATSGGKTIPTLWHFCDFLSVSPHGKPADLVYTRGTQLNLVPGLNGLTLADWADFDADGFIHKYVTPCDRRPFAVEECREWVAARKGWRLGVQAHKVWGVP